MLLGLTMKHIEMLVARIEALENEILILKERMDDHYNGNDGACDSHDPWKDYDG